MWKVEPRTVCWQPPRRPQVSVHPQLSHSAPALSDSHNHSSKQPSLCSVAYTPWFISACHLPMPKKLNREKWNNVHFFPFPLNKCVCNLHVPDASSCALQRTTMCLLWFNFEQESWRIIQNSTQCCTLRRWVVTGQSCPPAGSLEGSLCRPTHAAECTAKMFSIVWQRQWDEWLRDLEWYQLLFEYMVQVLANLCV